MCKKFTPDELNKMEHKTKNDVIYQMQDRLDRLEQNYENLIEQIRLAGQQRFGRQTEKLDDIAGFETSGRQRNLPSFNLGIHSGAVRKD